MSEGLGLAVTVVALWWFAWLDRSIWFVIVNQVILVFWAAAFALGGVWWLSGFAAGVAVGCIPNLVELGVADNLRLFAGEDEDGE